MKQCLHCGTVLPDAAVRCGNCGAVLTAQPAGPQQYQPGQAAPQHGAPVPPPQPVQAPPPQMAPQPRTPQWYPALPGGPVVRRVFSWADVCTVLGFASSIIGYFWASLVLLPLGMVASIVGFRGDKTRALAVAGIVVSVVGLLIKLMMILHEADLLPYWITNGIW